MTIYVCKLDDPDTPAYMQEYEADSLEEAEGIYQGFLKSVLDCEDDMPSFTCLEKKGGENL